MPTNDERTYIKLHDGMPDHPKVDGLSDKAFRLLIETWCWCSRHLTDGQVPQSTWLKRGTKSSRRELIDAGLVIVNATGGVLCHDYLSHQRSAEDVVNLREKKKLAGAKGNHDRWHVGPQGKPSASCPFCPHDEDAPPEDAPPDLHEESNEPSQSDRDAIAGAMANGIAPAIAHGSQKVSQKPRETSPETETEELLRNSQTDPLPSGGGVGEAGDAKARPTRPKTASRKRSAREDGSRIAEDWWPSLDDRRWVGTNCPNLSGQEAAITQEFVRYWQSKPGKDGRKLDWSLTYRNWMSRENRRGTTNPRRRKPSTGDTVRAGLNLAAQYAQTEAEQERQAAVHQLPMRGAS